MSSDRDPPPRLLFVSQWFDPEPTFKGLAFARRLQASGFDVEVVTGFPNYPGGRLYDGYPLRFIRRDVVDGIRVTRLPLYPSHSRNRIGRSANYVSFFVSLLIYLTLCVRRREVVYCYHPPVTVGLAVVLSQLIWRTPVVLDVQDMWPDTLTATGMVNQRWLLRLLDGLCRYVYKRVQRLVVLSPGFRRLLSERGVDPNVISVVPNWADEGALGLTTGSVPEAFAQANRFRVLFAGNMGLAQALESVLEAAAIVAKSRSVIEICFLGSGVVAAELAESAARRGLSNVRFLPRVPMTEVGDYLDAADALLVHLRDDPLFSITIPSKTQAYLAAGRAVIMAVGGDAAELIRLSGGGLAVPPEQPQALAEAIVHLADMPPDKRAEMGRRGRRFYESELSFAKGSAAIAAILHDAVRAKV